MECQTKKACIARKLFFSKVILIFFVAVIAEYSIYAQQKTQELPVKVQKKTTPPKTAVSPKKTEPSKTESIKEEIHQALDKVTTQEKSTTEELFEQHKRTSDLHNIVYFYKPTYVLPFYYTFQPYYSIYQGSVIPDNQKLDSSEIKGQISLYMPIFYFDDFSFNISYTQLLYWQFYVKSQYFRETNYEPTIFLKYRIHRNIYAKAELSHQSNGRGGELERSWNRVIGTLELTGKNWYTQFTGWGLIAQSESSDLHNSDIEKYLGHSLFILSYNLYGLKLSLEAQNIESGFDKGHVMLTASYPIMKEMLIYVQYFSGYGQSMIEYNHHTNSLGIGFTFNDWQ